MRRLALAAALLVLALWAAPAAGDSRMAIGEGVLYFRSEDAAISNQLTVDNDARGRAHFVDEADPYGISFPTPPCSPGRLNRSGNPVEVFCDKGSYHGIDVQLGPGEDHVTYSVDDLPATLEGGPGADTLTSGASPDILAGDEGDDTLRSGAGNDRLDGGPGADTIDAGPGDDTVLAADGVADTIDCGDGNDTATVDQADHVVNCEKVTKTDVAPPPDQPQPDDHRPPLVQAGGPSSQRIRRHMHLVVAATSSERGRIDVSSYLRAGGINDRIAPAAAPVPVGGAGVVVQLALTAVEVRRVMADLRHHRHPTAVVTVSASDLAGNTSRPVRLVIALRR